jgi:hypothetical protein
MVYSEARIITTNVIQNYLNIPNGPLTTSYWLAKGLTAIKGGSTLLPLLILI